MPTTWKLFSNKTNLIFLLSLHFIFLYSIVVFSAELTDDVKICQADCMVVPLYIPPLKDIHFSFAQYGIDNNAKTR